MPQEVIYDIEISPNRTIVGLYDPEDGPVVLDTKEALDNDTVQELDNRLNHGRRVFGFNNSGFDTYLISALMRGAPPKEVYDLGNAIITKKGAASFEVAREYGYDRTQYNEIDLLHYVKRASLKAYEARMNRPVFNLPFTPGEDITDDDYPRVEKYLIDDLEATYALRLETAGEIGVRESMEQIFGVQGLLGKTAASAASAVLVSEYCAETDAAPKWLREQSKKYWNCSFEFEGEPWMWQIAKGTVAEEFLSTIAGSRFEINNGKRIGPIGREWPEFVEIEGLRVSVGLGGVHSEDPGFDFNGTGMDVASLYPSLALLPGCVPFHLDQEIYQGVVRSLLNRRLDAKAAGDKTTANALKLVLNSGVFGVQNQKTSPLYSPLSFLNITLGGQISLLALGDRSSKSVSQS